LHGTVSVKNELERKLATEALHRNSTELEVVRSESAGNVHCHIEALDLPQRIIGMITRLAPPARSQAIGYLQALHHVGARSEGSFVALGKGA
jgi:hypothetical protein